MRRREVLGLAASLAATGCADRPLGRPETAASDGRAGEDDVVEVGPVDVQPSILVGESAFDVRGSSAGAFVRVPVRLASDGGTAATPGDLDVGLVDAVSVDLDGHTFGSTVPDRVRGRWDRVLAVEVPTGEYGGGAVRLDAGRGDPIRRPLPPEALAALADPPAFEVADFVVSDPIELMFLLVTLTVDNVGGADGRFLAGLGSVDGASPMVVAFPVRAGETVTQTRNLTLRHQPGGPVTVRLQWGSGSAERRVVQPGT